MRASMPAFVVLAIISVGVHAQDAADADDLLSANEKRGLNCDQIVPEARDGACREAASGTEILQIIPGQSIVRQDPGMRPCLAPASLNGNVWFAVQKKLAAISSRITAHSSWVPNVAVCVTDIAQINAFAHYADQPQWVEVTYRAADFFSDDESELAFIVGHELGHIYDKDCYSPSTPAQQRVCETRADRYGLDMVELAGFNPYGAAGWAGKMMMFGGDSDCNGGSRWQVESHNGSPGHTGSVKRSPKHITQAVCAVRSV